MKSIFFGFISFSFFLTLSQISSSSLVPTTPHSEFVRTQNTDFVLNGSSFLFNGFNSYWMMNAAVDPIQREKVSGIFRDASAAGLSVCRTWAFSDGGNFRALQISPGEYDELVFQALDFVISEAPKYGIYLILSLVNNHKDYGGRPQYAQWARDAGVQIMNDDEFYTNPVLMAYYKNHVKTVLTRFNTVTKIVYKDDPAIMAWELINEPNCLTDYSGRTIQGWIQEMSTYTKSIDRKHLLEIGLEGYYGDSMPERKQFNPGYQIGTDFISNNLIKEIDFATIHAYPDIWLSNQSDSSQLEFMQQWVESHWIDSKDILKKPLVLAEFGKSDKDEGYTISSRNLYMDEVYETIYNLAKRGGTLAGSLVWQTLAEEMESYHDGYQIVLLKNTSTTRLITAQSHKMATLGRKLNMTKIHN